MAGGAGLGWHSGSMSLSLVSLLGVHGLKPTCVVHVRHGIIVMWCRTFVFHNSTIVRESGRYSRFPVCFLCCPLGYQTERNDKMCQKNPLPKTYLMLAGFLVCTLIRLIDLIVVVTRYDCVITRLESQKNRKSTTAVMRSLQDMLLCKFKYKYRHT